MPRLLYAVDYLHALVGYLVVGLLCGGGIGCAAGLLLEPGGNHLPALTIVLVLAGMAVCGVIGIGAGIISASRRPRARNSARPT